MSKRNFILAGFIIAKFILQYNLIDSVYDLHRDEYLHLDQAHHLAWGYQSVPPVTSWISYLILLLGNSVFWVKFFPALFGALTMVVVWKIIEALHGKTFALILGATSVLFSVLLRINTLYQPNSLDIFFWTCFYYTVIQYISVHENKWLYAAAITFAFGFLSKYNIVFLLIGLFPALAVTDQRRVFRNKHLYYSIAAGIVLILPNFAWQYQHDFPGIHHLNALAKVQLEKVNRVDFLKEQLLFFYGSLFVIVAAFISFFNYKPFKEFRLFFWAFLFSLLVFIYFKAKGYYAIGLYPVLIAFGSVYWEQLVSRKWRLYLRPVLILIPVVLFIPAFKILFPNQTPIEIQQQSKRYRDLGLLRWEDGKEHAMPQDFADMLGWSELAIKTDSALSLLPDQEDVLILCDNYGQAGAINFYSKNKTFRAVSFNADYINWFRLETPIKDVIIVKEVNDTDRTKERSLFETVELVGEIQNEFAREQGTKIYILRNAKSNINNLITEEIEKRKNRNY